MDALDVAVFDSFFFKFFLSFHGFHVKFPLFFYFAVFLCCQTIKSLVLLLSHC